MCSEEADDESRHAGSSSFTGQRTGAAVRPEGGSESFCIPLGAKTEGREKKKQYVAWYELQTRLSSPVLLHSLRNDEKEDALTYFA